MNSEHNELIGESPIQMIARIEREIYAVINNEKQYLNKRIHELENSISIATENVFNLELENLNSIAQHTNLIESALEEGRNDIDTFFQGIHGLEIQKGKIGAYDDVLGMLRKTQVIYAQAVVEINAQKKRHDALMTRLKQSNQGA